MFTIVAFGFTVGNAGSKTEACGPEALFCLRRAAHVTAASQLAVILRGRPCPGPAGQHRAR